MSDVENSTSGAQSRVADSHASPAGRHALMAFIAIEVVALPVLLYLGHDRWFQHDEWDFLASREATSLHDLFAPHDVHWTTLPVLVYRGLWSVFGIGSYVPYQTASVLVHLVVAALIRVVMRRAGVGPWTATAAATLLVFFGSGEENITWAFQITFTGAIAFGLAHLLLADHDGPVDRRDWLGLLAGLCALLCSGAAVAMVLVVGLAVLLRRGWRTALLHTLPLATVYVAWYVAIGKDADANRHTGSLVETARFVGTAVAETFGGLAAVKLLGWLLGAFLVAGLVLAWKSLPREELRSVAAAPAALLVGAFAFLLMTGVGRVDTGLDYLSGATRYVYIAGALSLPAIAVAADAFIRRWRPAAVLLALAFLLSLTANVQEFTHEVGYGQFLGAYRTFFLSIPHLPITQDMPRSAHPEPLFAPQVTLGWMRDGVASGRIPDPGPIDDVERATTESRVALQPTPKHRPVTCERTVGPTHVSLAAGNAIRIAERAQVRIIYTDASGTKSNLVVHNLSPSASLVALAGPLELDVSATTSDASFDVCTGRTS